MELAKANLWQVIRETELHGTAKWQLCLDICIGLDALHDCTPSGLVHGDLKPQNVLIFERGNRLIAKLADFGFSIDSDVPNVGVRLGGTPGWLAPEVSRGDRLNPQGLFAADIYSCGLVVWSIVFSRVDPPFRTDTQELLKAAARLHLLHPEEPPVRMATYVEALQELLREDASFKNSANWKTFRRTRILVGL